MIQTFSFFLFAVRSTVSAEVYRENEYLLDLIRQEDYENFLALLMAGFELRDCLGALDRFYELKVRYGDAYTIFGLRYTIDSFIKEEQEKQKPNSVDIAR